MRFAGAACGKNLLADVVAGCDNFCSGIEFCRNQHRTYICKYLRLFGIKQFPRSTGRSSTYYTCQKLLEDTFFYLCGSFRVNK